MARAAEPNRRLAQRGIPRPKAAEWIRALNAPLRRRIMRALHDAGEARSPNELAEALDIPLSNVSYHVRVLKECHVLALTDTQQKRGSVEHFYASTVMSNDQAVELLEVTKKDDE